MTAAQRAQVAAAISEDGLLSNTIALATTLHWLIHHCRPAHTDRGWRTPIQGTAGFPDLVMVRSGWQLVAELKAQRGRLTAGQTGWQTAYQALAGTPGSRVRYFVWRPADMLDGTIRDILTDPAGVTP